MNKQMTEEDIFKKYPKIFKDKDRPMQETCMCWGLGVPDSWLPIIDDLCYAMSNYTYTTYEDGKPVEFPQVVAEQVKAKFGCLRFYYRLEYPEGVDVAQDISGKHYSYIDGMIAFAEHLVDKHEKELRERRKQC